MVNNIRVMPTSGVTVGDYIESDRGSGTVKMIDQFETSTTFLLDTGRVIEPVTFHSNSLVMVIS